MTVELRPHQIKAIKELNSGSLLRGGVGTGKSITAIGYFYEQVCGGDIASLNRNEPKPFVHPRSLYIITTAKKRDSLEWDGELVRFLLSTHIESSFGGVRVIIDSWNNISQYKDVRDSFFIFDEQRLVGSGAWVKSFIKISRYNEWILLSATPGDTWMDYAPVFIANRFYLNISDFKRQHVVYNNFSKFPKVDHYVETGRLERHRRAITVDMPYIRHTRPHTENIITQYDKEKFDDAVKRRWNIYEDKPMKDVGELFRVMRRIVNSDVDRLAAVMKLIEKHPKLILFYNFDYELEMLRTLEHACGIAMGEWNGHRHQSIPSGDRWLYLVHYSSGSEGWNCISTNALASFSLNYSWRQWEQAKGRIDRLNTPFTDLYYYILRSVSPIDNMIMRSIATKQEFNERRAFSKLSDNFQVNE